MEEVIRENTHPVSALAYEAERLVTPRAPLAAAAHTRTANAEDHHCPSTLPYLRGDHPVTGHIGAVASSASDAWCHLEATGLIGNCMCPQR